MNHDSPLTSVVTQSIDVSSESSLSKQDLDKLINQNSENSVPHEQEILSLTALPEHACKYCGVSNPRCVVRCDICKKWFCNGKSGTTSHIISHMVLSRHHEVSLHSESDLGETELECYSCGNKDPFMLGFVSAKTDTIVVILCRIPCSQAKDSDWNTANWQPLVEERCFLDWIADYPTPLDMANARAISPLDISKLERQWRSDETATLEDIKDLSMADAFEPVLDSYVDGREYQKIFSPLVDATAQYDKQLTESQGLNYISVSWSMSPHNYHLAKFSLSSYDSSNLKIAVGDEIILHYDGIKEDKWQGSGYVIKLPATYSEGFTLELQPSSVKPPTEHNVGFRAEIVWKGISFQRMQAALTTFAERKSISKELYDILLGHKQEQPEFTAKLPEAISVPNFTQLNPSQVNAVNSVLQRRLSLIQGPPGTGKTVTSATIVYHLAKSKKKKVLVTASSNIAVDHLASKLEDIGLKVVRVTARSRENVESAIDHLSLSSLVSNTNNPVLKKLLKKKDELGSLSKKDMNIYISQTKKAEAEILASAHVVCCTCSGAGDKRLANIKFPYVLIDESTQPSEPESLIPIVKGAKQVVLVGDHQQLGPVILHNGAAKAGLTQSLFERLIKLGHVPIRLEVQYRMHPALSEFPSNMFYDGSLQNGVSHEQRLIRRSSFPWPAPGIPLLFWSSYGTEEISISGTSFLNRSEAMNCEKIISRLLSEGIKPHQIGVITPYQGQRDYIVQYLLMNGAHPDREIYQDVEVASVDAFQGREKDFIIFSCTRSNHTNTIGFLKDARRLNVAITRAKYGLFVLGNIKTLQKDPLWNRLLVHFRDKGALVEGRLDSFQLYTASLDSTRFKSSGEINGFNQDDNKTDLNSNGLGNPKFTTENLSSTSFSSLHPFRANVETDSRFVSNPSIPSMSPFLNQPQWMNPSTPQVNEQVRPLTPDGPPVDLRFIQGLNLDEPISELTSRFNNL
ncbi:BA75_03891T0 [Komagataella pastoris]|uniref:BA75_03891T0 n=1 Tax=Komagataella pastoris TaxID=4922 RepID=A0A1B2JG76_PICPA|nr:BA75_03891T0 [Komagataella pastoris]